MLFPRQTVPTLNIDTISHGRFDLRAQTPERMTLVAFYRGLHCPICATYLTELDRLVPEFADRGVGTVAVSSDTRERAEAMAQKIRANNVPIGYALELPVARRWGLYVSASRGKTSIGVEEPALFSEPGVFLVKRDGTLYYGAVQTMPFARPHFGELLKAVDFAIANDYPARGEVTEIGAVS